MTTHIDVDGMDLLGDPDLLGIDGDYASTAGYDVQDVSTMGQAAVLQSLLSALRGGAAPRLPPRPGVMVPVGRPAWRGAQIAPGVMAPREHLHPLPLTPDVNNGVFTAAFTNINFTARPQKPFRGERLIAIVARAGATATGLLPVATGIFVGTDLQQVQAGNIPLEVFVAGAFGVRLYFTAAQPGIDIRIPVVLTGALTAPDTITVTLVLLGRSIGA